MTRFAVVLALRLCPAMLLADTPHQVLERSAELVKTWPISVKADMAAGHRGHGRR